MSMTVPVIVKEFIKRTEKHHWILLLLLAVIIFFIGIPSQADAIPTTMPATLIGSNNVTLSMMGATGDCWYRWGMASMNESWITPNHTPVFGDDAYTVTGMPLLPGTLFYFVACDSTGCGNELSFVTASMTPMPTQLQFEEAYKNITETHFDPRLIAWNAIRPYFWVVPQTIVWTLLFGGIFVGLWLRQRGLEVAILLGFITSVFLMYSGVGLMIGLPVEVAAIAQGIAFAGLAGIILSLIKK